MSLCSISVEASCHPVSIQIQDRSEDSTCLFTKTIRWAFQTLPNDRYQQPRRVFVFANGTPVSSCVRCHFSSCGTQTGRQKCVIHWRILGVVGRKVLNRSMPKSKSWVFPINSDFSRKKIFCLFVSLFSIIVLWCIHFFPRLFMFYLKSSEIWNPV